MVTASTGVSTAAWRIRAAAGITTTAIAWLSSQLTIHKGSLLQGSLQVKTLTHQVASGTGLQLHTADVLRYSEVLFLLRHLLVLDALGVKRYARLLPPQAVKYVCEDYCIDLPPELQDQRVLQSHQLYQKVVRELQLTTFFEGKWTKITEIPPDF